MSSASEWAAREAAADRHRFVETDPLWGRVKRETIAGFLMVGDPNVVAEAVGGNFVNGRVPCITIRDRYGHKALPWIRGRVIVHFVDQDEWDILTEPEYQKLRKGIVS